MRYELQSVGVWSIVKVGFFFNLVAGFLFGLLAAPFLGAVLSVLMSSPWAGQADVDPSALSAVTIFVIVPLISAVIFAALNTLLLAILTVVYNLVATLLGGLEFDFRDIEADQDEGDAVDKKRKPKEAGLVAPTAPDRRPETPPPPPPVQDNTLPVRPEVKPDDKPDSKPPPIEVEPTAPSNHESS